VTAAGVILEDLGTDGISTLLTSGEVWSHSVQDIAVSLPGFIPTGVVERAGREATPTNDSERQTRLSIIQELRLFEREILNLGNFYHRSLQDIYANTRAKDPDQWSTIKVQEVLNAYPPPPNAHLYAARVAIHRFFVTHPETFCCDDSHAFNLTFHVIPLKEFKNFRLVRGWLRTGAPEITEFITKAKRIVNISRRLDETRNERRLRMADDEAPVFADADWVIITFLKASIRRPSRLQVDMYSGLVGTLVKKVGVYDADITPDVVFNFLQDIGAVPPWEDFVSLYRERFLREADFCPLSHYKDTPRNALDGLPKEDRHAAIRHDWGELPVYVIDAEDAEELDDGVSIEPTAQDGSTWIHAHIADPTTRLPPNHPLAIKAAQRSTTLYLPQETYPMLPPQFVHANGGLVANTDNQSYQEVLTFSAKIDASGHIIDSAVRPGVVRNVHVVSYASVDACWGWVIDPAVYPFGRPLSERLSRSFLPQEHHKTLDSLRAVTEMIRLARGVHQSPFVPLPSGRVYFEDKPVPTNPPHIHQPTLWKGFPILSYRVEKGADSPARRVIAEVMVTACRVAGRFCTANGLPGLYRVQQPSTATDEHGYRELLQLHPTTELDLKQMLQFGLTFSRSSYSIDPTDHSTLGVSAKDGGYIRTTSPLRRFTDMIMHWQIKHALLPGSKRPLISRETMEDYAEQMLDRELKARRFSQQSDAYWVAKFIDMWLRFRKDEPVLHSMPGVVTTAPVFSSYVREMETRIFLPKIGRAGHLYTPRGKDVPGIGADVTVKVDSINFAGGQRLVVKLL
jgi:exoribonuclease II